jgi:hypothetical protein
MAPKKKTVDRSKKTLLKQSKSIEDFMNRKPSKKGKKETK